MKILFDTSALIELERQNQEAIALVKGLITGSEEIVISTVTVSEVLLGVYFQKAYEKIEEARKLLSQFKWIPLDENIADVAARYEALLLNIGNEIEFKDAAIAATFAATKSDFLITQNKGHFQILPDIGNRAKTIAEFSKIYR
ncbi:PIN domain-containing protein [Candidatus Woesearchaeota archaeon]|nr:PIN domain-containing protein [Candidatus Woesearchaeota archaeon]